MLSCNFKEERSKTFSLRNLVDSYYLWIWKTNVSLSLIFHIFITKFHSSSCSLVDHQFGLLRPSCPLQLWTKSKPDKHAVIVTQAALGGTLTFLELEAAEYCTGGECVQCLCVCVCQCDHWGSRLCVYMAEFPMTNAVRTSSRFGNVQTKKKKQLLQLCYYSFSTNMCFQSIKTLCVCVFSFSLHTFTMSLENNVLCFVH